MRRLGSSDSLGALMSICPISDGFDEKEWVEASGHVTEKKRRLNVDQVKGLEKDFEVENKLDPVRKLKLAQQLGLEPRQVAIWFQNRRARWKTKQLERDYGVLKTRYETLKVNYDTLHHDNQLLLKEIKEVKAKLNGASNVSVEEEAIVLETDDKTLERSEQEQKQWINYDRFNKSNGSIGLSEYSDSSGILNEDDNKSSSNNVAVSSSGILHRQHVLMSQKNVKMEEHDLLSADEACNFFSNEEAPSLDWYCSEQWN